MDLMLEVCNEIGIVLSNKQLAGFENYMNYLVEQNNYFNLTAITEPEDVIIKHFVDSLILTKCLNFKLQDSLIDIGTGAGFPGVPIKIFNESINLTLIDSLNKRILFLNKLMDKLGLTAAIFHGRAEEMGHNKKFREKFDFATSRAVAPLNILVEYCLPFVKEGGCFAALKGSEIEKELTSSEKAIKILGGKLERIETFDLPLNKGRRNIVIIQKNKPTVPLYPRSNSKISNYPL